MNVKPRRPVPLLDEEAPQAVKLAVLLFIFVWCGDIYFFSPIFSYAIQRGLFVSEAQRVGSILMLVFMVSWLCLNAALTLGLAYRKNWARVTEMLLTLFGLLLVALSFSFKRSLSPGILYFANAAATVLLFLPPATSWFTRR
jgi:hypothetical protein